LHGKNNSVKIDTAEACRVNSRSAPACSSIGCPLNNPTIANKASYIVGQKKDCIYAGIICFNGIPIGSTISSFPNTALVVS
jgi:hypothetical protein